MSDPLEDGLFHRVRRTCKERGLLAPGDRVLVALSGGKDSYTMLHLLDRLVPRLPFAVELIAVHLDQGQPGYDGTPLVHWLEARGGRWEVLREDTYSVVTDKLAPGSTYCSLCSRLRRGILYTAAERLGCTKIALGHHRSGLFTSDDALAAELLNAGDAALDPCWRMPLDEEYDEGLKSNFADMGNVGPRAGGSITAAMFLRRYTGKYRWAHLDIAGTAWKSGSAKGATGRPVALLTHFVLSQVK